MFFFGAKVKTMKKFIILLILYPLFINSQNLINNSSFEDTTSCPTSCNQFYRAVNWYNPSLATPDLIHSCSITCDFDANGYQLPRTGDAYAGIATGNPSSNFREYIEASFISPLVAGNCYHIEFYVSAGHYKYTTTEMHIVFSDSLLLNYPTTMVLQFTPDFINPVNNIPDTMNWTLVSGDYIAVGGENYMLIGNFKDTANSNFVILDPNSTINTSYTYIDDVSLVHIPCTSLDEYPVIKHSVFPNPTSEIINFRIESDGLFELRIIDNLSRLCYFTTIQKSKEINLKSFKPGLYFYKLTNANYSITNKILIK